MYSKTTKIYVILNDQKDPFLINRFKASLNPQNSTPVAFQYNVVMTTMVLMMVVKQNTMIKGCGFSMRTFSVQLTTDFSWLTAHKVSNMVDKTRHTRFVRQSIAWDKTKLTYINYERRMPIN